MVSVKELKIKLIKEEGNPSGNPSLIELLLDDAKQRLGIKSCLVLAHII